MLLSAAGFFWYASLGPTFGTVQNVVEPRRRATATALLYICAQHARARPGAPVHGVDHRSIRRLDALPPWRLLFAVLPGFFRQRRRGACIACRSSLARSPPGAAYW